MSETLVTSKSLITSKHPHLSLAAEVEKVSSKLKDLSVNN